MYCFEKGTKGMIYIGICDDEEFSRAHIRGLCKEYFAKQAYEYQIYEFSSGEQILEFRECKFHLLFLDIEMDGIGGIEVLHKIEETDRVWRIVFISGHQEMVFEALGIKTLGFSGKPVTYEKVAKWLEVAIRENQENQIYECVVGQQKEYKSLDEIYCLEAAGNYTWLCEKQKKYLVNDNLKAWQDKMEHTSMIRVHKSYLINMDYVKKWENGQILLLNNIEVTLGRQYKKSASEVYYNYICKKALGRL